MRLEELVEVIGVDGALLLCGQYGGARLHVPAEMEPGHHLAQLVGLEAAEKMSARAGGCTIEIPKADAWNKARRDEQLRLDRSRGLSQAALARKYKLTQRWVRAILNRTAQQPSGEVGI